MCQTDEQPSTRPMLAIGAYLLANAVWIAGVVSLKRAGLPPMVAAVASGLVPAIVVAVGVWFLAAKMAPGGRADLFSLRWPPRWAWWAALGSGFPAVAVLLWHVSADPAAGWLTWSSAGICAKLLVNQALFEEWMARGFLLGLLSAASLTERRTVWAVALAFGSMHILQFLVPPVTVEGIVNGVVLLVLTTPLGAATAYLTLKSRSLYPAVVLHFLIDLMVLPQALGSANVGLILLATLGGSALVPVLVRLLGPADL